MKVRIERDVLAEAVTWAARSLPTRPAQPVLAGLVLTAVGDTLVLSGKPEALALAEDKLVSGR